MCAFHLALDLKIEGLNIVDDIISRKEVHYE